MIWKVRKIKAANMVARKACQSLNAPRRVATIRASFAMNAGKNSRETKSALSRSADRTRGATRPVQNPTVRASDAEARAWSIPTYIAFKKLSPESQGMHR